LDHSTRWVLLAGDTSALPAISTILECVPSQVHPYVFLELNHDDDLQVLQMPANQNIQWGLCHARHSALESALLKFIREFVLPSGRGHAWLGGEASTVLLARAHLLSKQRVSAKQIHCVAHWKRGEHDY